MAIKHMFYNFTGGAIYKELFIIYFLLLAFTYTDLFKKIEPDEFYRECVRIFLLFYIRLYFYVFIYYLYWNFRYNSSFAVHMVRIFLFFYLIQIRTSFLFPEQFLFLMVFQLFIYVFVAVYFEEPFFFLLKDWNFVINIISNNRIMILLMNVF